MSNPTNPSTSGESGHFPRVGGRNARRRSVRYASLARAERCVAPARVACRQRLFPPFRRRNADLGRHVECRCGELSADGRRRRGRGRSGGHRSRPRDDSKAREAAQSGHGIRRDAPWLRENVGAGSEGRGKNRTRAHASRRWSRLSLTPLKIEKITAVRRASAQLDVVGEAVIFASSPYARMPSDLAERLASGRAGCRGGGSASRAPRQTEHERVWCWARAERAEFLCAAEARRAGGPTGEDHRRRELRGLRERAA